MVSRLLIRRSPNSVSALNAASGCSACGFIVSVLKSALSASDRVRPGAGPLDDAGLQLLEPEAVLPSRARRFCRLAHVLLPNEDADDD
jgi:hypothetical protein